MGLKLQFLGSWQATLDDQLLPTTRAKRVEGLLAYLAYENRRRHSRLELDTFFFPDLFEKARMNLRQTLSRLRRSLGGQQAQYLLLQNDYVQFQLANDVSLDTHEFERLTKGCAQHATAQISCLDCMTNMEKATALCRGPFLQDLNIDDCQPFDEWVTFQRALWQDRVNHCLRQLVLHYEQRGDYRQAVVHARRLLNIEPWDEAGHRQLMRLLARMGQRSAAIAQYHACCDLLEQELGLPPEPETVTLFKKIASIPNKRPANLLPLRQEEIIGREKETALILQHLNHPPTRLLTVLGTGGIGKTLLATTVTYQLVAEKLGPFMNGVFALSLADAKVNREKLISHIAQALKIKISNHLSLRRQIEDFLKEKELLLFIDNGELLDGSGRQLLSQLLAEIKSLQLLLTSRKRLNLLEETVLTIDGLPFAEEIDPQGHYPATRLVLARARKIQAEMVPDGDDWAGIARLTQLTAGMPLAIELATSWTRVMRFGEIAAEIRQTLQILETTLQDVPPRHRSIRVVFEQSWQMLDVVQQAVLMGLATFADQFEMKAARKIAQATRTNLLALVDQSLLQVSKVDNVSMYSLHPLLRQFLRERASEETQQRLKEQHSHYYRELLESLLPKLDSDGSKEAFEVMERNLEDIKLGWQTAVSQQNAVRIGQYASALHDIFTIRGWARLGRDMLEEAAVLVEDSIIDTLLPFEECRAWAILFSRLGEFNQAIGSLRRAESVLKISQALNYRNEDGKQIYFVRKKLGLIQYRRGNLTNAYIKFKDCHSFARENDDIFELAGLNMVIGAIYYEQRAFRQAHKHLLLSVRQFEDLDIQWGLIHALRWLSVTSFQLGLRIEATEYLNESERLSLLSHDQLGLALLMWRKGQLALEKRELENALEILTVGLKISGNLNDLQTSIRILVALAYAKINQKEYVGAKRYLRAAHKMILQLEQPPLLLKFSTALAMWAQHNLVQSDHFLIRDLIKAIVTHPACSPLIHHQLKKNLLWHTFPTDHDVDSLSTTQQVIQFTSQLLVLN